VALGATIYHFQIAVSDVDGDRYATLDLRLARHPSESMRYLCTRTLAYCLSYEPGIAFSKGGLSSSDDPPVSVEDPGGRMLAWIDVGTPSAERLHKASKLTGRVRVFTSDEAGLVREALRRDIHRSEAIEVNIVDPTLLSALENGLGRTAKLDVSHVDGQLYVTLGDQVLIGELRRLSLAECIVRAGG
jgi:uncharacterized protein YaeQ